MDAKKQKVKEIASRLLENKETITYWEKHAKAGVCLVILACMVVSSPAMQEEDLQWLPSPEALFTGLTNQLAWLDFLKREGVLLLVVIGGFFAAARHNRHLDELEAEAETQYRQKLRQERIKKGGETGEIPEECSDEDSQSSSEHE